MRWKECDDFLDVWNGGLSPSLHTLEFVFVSLSLFFSIYYLINKISREEMDNYQ